MFTLADASPFFFQKLVFDALSIENPGTLAILIFDIVVILAVFVPAVMVFAMFAIWWERKVAGHMQSRLGPNRVGPIGILQSLADGIKLLTKEGFAIVKASTKLLLGGHQYTVLSAAFKFNRPPVWHFPAKPGRESVDDRSRFFSWV